MKVRRYVLIALLCTTVAIFGRAQTAPLRTIGLVEVPRLFNLYSPDGHRIAPAKNFGIELRTRPALDSPIAARIVAPDQLKAKEYGYEELGAVVYARDRNWSFVETSKGVAGWLAPADAGAFHSLESLITDGLTYLTDDWNGFVSESPDSARRVRVPGDPARTLVGFLVPQVKTATSHPVFARPDRSARVIRRVTTKDPDAALQTSHSIPHQVLVLDRRPGWFRVAPADQHLGQMEGAWLEEAPIWRFHAVTDEAEQRTLADRAWGPEDWNVRTLGTRRVGDALWIEVEVLSHSFCEDPRKPPVVRARGWIPAHAPSGLPNIWFYSRGC
jgi:hypothetical protein